MGSNQGEKKEQIQGRDMPDGLRNIKEGNIAGAEQGKGWMINKGSVRGYGVPYQVGYGHFKDFAFYSEWDGEFWTEEEHDIA